MATRSQILESDYNPFDHRERTYPIGSIYALINVIKGILGTGILAIPQSFQKIGLINGVIFSIIISILVAYCVQLLFGGMYYVCKRNKTPQVTYPTTLKEAFSLGPDILKKFANCSTYAVTLFLLMYQFGACCVYLMFSASNTKTVIDGHTDKRNHLSLTVYIMFYIIPCLLLTYIRDLKKLAPFANIGNILTAISLIIIYFCVLQNLPPISERNCFGKLEEFPLFMGTCMFSVISLGPILSVEHNMKDGGKFIGLFGVLNQAIIIVAILNIFTGFFGYWKYGDEILPSITLNLGENWYAWSVQLLMSIVMMLSFPLQAYPNTEILWDQYIEKYMETSEHKTFWNYCIRTIMVLSVFMITVPLPFLGLFISFIGALCLSLLGIILPAFIDICFRWNDNEFGRCYYILIKNIFIMLVGLVSMITGTYFPLLNIYQRYQEVFNNPS